MWSAEYVPGVREKDDLPTDDDSDDSIHDSTHDSIHDSIHSEAEEDEEDTANDTAGTDRTGATGADPAAGRTRHDRTGMVHGEAVATADVVVVVVAAVAVEDVVVGRGCMHVV